MNAISPAAVWLVSAVLVEAAVIDGRRLRVPNWLTFHLAAGGLAYSAWSAGTAGALASLGGLAIGLALLMPLYAIGGMGAGDVKLLGAVGAWVGPWLTIGAFAASAVAGGLIALALVARSGDWSAQVARAVAVAREIAAVRHPDRLAETAAARKPTSILLPYAIPIAVGSIAYFAWAGLYA